MSESRTASGAVPPVSAFETGTNTWRKLPAWPVAGEGTTTRATPFYLEAGLKVSTTAPKAGDAPFEEYVSNPAKPVPFRARPIQPVGYDAAHTWPQWLTDDQREASGRVKRQPERLKLKALKFVLDAGHGGDNAGALGSTGAKEKDVNLSTVLHLKELLEDKGATVLLTRGADSAASMQGRLQTALGANPDILISVHSNSIGYTTNPEETRGVSTYYKHIGFRPLSEFILKRVVAAGLPSYGNVGSFNFILVSPTEMPNVLVELAYMSNPQDEMKLLDDGFRKDLARAIVRGVEDFLDSCDE